MGRKAVSRIALVFVVPITFQALTSTMMIGGDPQGDNQPVNSPVQVGGTHGPIADYVPCMFDEDEQRYLRTQRTEPPEPAPIDAVTALKLVQATSAAIAEAKGGYSPEYLNAFKTAYIRELQPGELENKTLNEAYTIITRALERASKLVSDTEFYLKLPAPERAVRNPALDYTAILQQLTPVILTTSAHLFAGPYKPPEDVSCSMSIMQWKETSDTFGRRVANAYIAIQVNIRNLNTKNEFLIHDVQIAVDTAMDGALFARFQAGRDKLLVRAVAQRGQSEDRRNLVLHALELIGAIAGSSSIAGSADFKSSVAVFQGAFIPGYSTLFPDHTVEQLNHINDLVFSASNTSKVIVPVQGSVPLVTFLAEKPVEQMPFAWCGYTESKFGLSHSVFPHRMSRYCSVDSGLRPQRSKVPFYFGAEATPQNRAPWTTKDLGEKYGNDQPWDDLPFKKWKPLALEVLQRHTFVVIAGVHIQEVPGTPKLSNIDCPTLPNGSVDISQMSDGVVSCSNTGSNLDKAASVALEKGGTKIAGKIKAAKDGNSANLQFDPEVLSDGDGVYSVYLIDNSGGATDSGDIIQLQPQPFVSKVGNTTVDLKQAAATVKLDGKHLDLLDTVFLVPDNGSGGPVAGTIPTPAGPKDTSVAISFKSSDLKTGKDYHLRYTMSKVLGKQFDRPSITVKTSGSPVDVSVDPPTLTFANQAKGTHSKAKKVNVTNKGSGPITDVTFSVDGADAAQFKQQNSCGTSLAAGTPCSISVTFNPTETGEKHASLAIADRSGDLKLSVTLSGGATAPAPKKNKSTPPAKSPQ